LDNSPLNQRNLFSKVYDSRFNFALGLRETIYSIDLKDNKITPEYIFDFGNQLSFQDFSNLSNPLQYFMENDFYVGIIDIFQNKNFLTFSCLSNSGIQGYIVSKNDRKIYSTNSLIKEKIGNLRLEGILGITNNQRFIAVIGKEHSKDWDLSINPSLRSQYKELGNLDPEELVLLVFDLK
jgi:hypothetical protein